MSGFTSSIYGPSRGQIGMLAWFSAVPGHPLLKVSMQTACVLADAQNAPAVAAALERSGGPTKRPGACTACPARRSRQRRRQKPDV